jgi:septal ring factor EnvC (AmiA/AmiB activator)
LIFIKRLCYFKKKKKKSLLDVASVRPIVLNETTTTNDQQIKMIRQNNTSGAAAAALPTITSLSSKQSSSSSAITLTPEQIAKLNSELDIVECNVQVFNDVINELTNTQQQNKNLDDYNAEIELLRVSEERERGRMIF